MYSCGLALRGRCSRLLSAGLWPGLYVGVVVVAVGDSPFLSCSCPCWTVNTGGVDGGESKRSKKKGRPAAAMSSALGPGPASTSSMAGSVGTGAGSVMQVGRVAVMADGCGVGVVRTDRGGRMALMAGRDWGPVGFVDRDVFEEALVCGLVKFRNCWRES